MPNTQQVTENHANGQTVITKDVDGVKTTVTKPLVANVYRGDLLAKTAYRQHKVWNPNTSAYITVNMTGNEAQDAALLAAAFVTAGPSTVSVISST